MLMPNDFLYKSDTLISYYQDFEDWLLKDIAERLLTSQNVGGTADRELLKLTQYGMNQEEILIRLEQLTKLSNVQLRAILQSAVLTSWKDDKRILKAMGLNPTSPLENKRVRRVMDAEYLKVRGEIYNLTRTTLASTESVITQLLNQVEIRVAMGDESYTSAVCSILDKFAQAGISVEYPTGTKRTLESAVRCAVVTSMNQTSAQVTNQYISEYGIEYVLISAHNGARHDKKYPETFRSHDWWQGKVFKIVGSEAGIPNLLESTGYTIDPTTGEGTVVNPLGLHGYNCRHSHQPFSKGMDNPWEGVIDSEESQKQYEVQQHQRAMERGIRKTKRQLEVKTREVNLAPSDELKADQTRLSQLLERQQIEYNKFSKSNNLVTLNDRIRIARP